MYSHKRVQQKKKWLAFRTMDDRHGILTIEDKRLRGRMVGGQVRRQDGRTLGR